MNGDPLLTRARPIYPKVTITVQYSPTTGTVELASSDNDPNTVILALTKALYVTLASTMRPAR